MSRRSQRRQAGPSPADGPSASQQPVQYPEIFVAWMPDVALPQPFDPDTYPLDGKQPGSLAEPPLEPYDPDSFVQWGRQRFGDAWFELRTTMIRERRCADLAADSVYRRRQQALRVAERMLERRPLEPAAGVEDAGWKRLWARMASGRPEKPRTQKKHRNWSEERHQFRRFFQREDAVDNVRSERENRQSSKVNNSDDEDANDGGRPSKKTRITAKGKGKQTLPDADTDSDWPPDAIAQKEREDLERLLEIESRWTGKPKRKMTEVQRLFRQWETAHVSTRSGHQTRTTSIIFCQNQPQIQIRLQASARSLELVVL
ncbi:hypothetical protein CMQ_8267 [Grosmannia clavigera kw1407]|uniref:Uncharacterized protein n=1 Tax=Grosmannia clavigera (strain kw1407 / UAMH 11150) TaxID=655863 RepID=F0XL76_GROCL|nr:uncharacterized protein CMQ_8267 [Grosmannia clavigera kw1407]EFX01801.1 hypothetical protein CMQ_8267 [Grosmannia clavigera kw1407]